MTYTHAILYCVILILILYCTATYHYVLINWRCMYVWYVLLNSSYLRTYLTNPLVQTIEWKPTDGQTRLYLHYLPGFFQFKIQRLWGRYCQKNLRVKFLIHTVHTGLCDDVATSCDRKTVHCKRCFNINSGRFYYPFRFPESIWGQTVIWRGHTSLTWNLSTIGRDVKILMFIIVTVFCN